jgi:PAS domain S-box-containing protein
MTRTPLDRGPFLRAADLRILIAMIVGAAVFGIVDGSMWRGLSTPTIAYRPAILFALTLVFGWRGLVCSQIVFLIAFASYRGWQGAVLMTPLFLVSYACAFWTGRALGGKNSWLSGERSTLAFLAAAAIAPLLPALLGDAFFRLIGITLNGGVLEFVNIWIREFAAILILTPVVLVYSHKLAEWCGVSVEGEPPPPMSSRNVLEVAVETAAWAAALWLTVDFKARYGLNITYLTFLPPLAFTLLRGMRTATLAIAAKGILATTLWSQLHWAGALPITDLRLLIAIYSATILVLASVVDERKRASRQIEELRLEEAALRKSEEHFRTLANSAPVMIWLSGTDNLCTFVNEPWLKFTGRTLMEELGYGWIAGVHSDDMDRCVTTVTSSFDARRNYQLEYRLRRADGEYRWIFDKGTPIYRDGEFVGYIGSCIDVTELKRADEALRESEERFRKVFEEGPLGLALVGNDYRFVKVNAALCQMVGYPEASLLQMTFADITHPDDLQADVDLAERLFRGEIPLFTLQKRYIKKNGEIIWINLTASILHDKDGATVYGLAMVEDITEVKHAREVEERLASDLASSRDEIRALAASLMRAQEDERRRVSRELHDHICHQLGSLAREISSLAAGPLPSKNVRAKLEEIRSHVVKTSQETQHIAHQMHTSVLDDLGLIASLKDLCRQFSNQYPDIALDFENQGPPASMASEVSTCLYRVAEESLQNIAKHSRAKSISVRVGSNKEAVQLTIRDDGAGFDVKAVKGNGGLGLISMKERAHSINGKLTITGRLGYGTQIALKVPLQVQQPLERPRVLLADDHPVVLEEIRSVLAPSCEIVQTVADGRALVEAALRLKPDLIVVDITMPLLSGIDAAVQIKKSLPEMKVLFVTMHASTAYLKAAFEAGGTGYILKSGLRDELPEAVQSVLGGRTYVSRGLSTEYAERLRGRP